MANIKTYNSKGEIQGSMELDDKVFAVAPKGAVVHQVYRAMLANAREPWAESKGKGEIRGGGKKPWKQKGTGRARHGSIRSPLWRGGGVTFGPRNERNYKQKINQKMNQLAVKMCLSDKVKADKFVILEDFMASGKTKELADLRHALPGAGYSTLWLLPGKDEKMVLGLRSLKNIDYKRAIDVNVIDLLHHRFVILTQKGVLMIEKRLKN